MSGPVIAVSAQDLVSSHRRVYAMNLAEIEQLSDELNHHQPVLMHTLVGFRLVYPEPRVSGELALIGLVLWHAFRGFAALRERRIDDELYDRLADRNFAFLKYLDGEGTRRSLAGSWMPTLPPIGSCRPSPTSAE